MTLTELSHLTGIALPRLSLLENGEKVSDDNLSRLATFYGVSPDILQTPAPQFLDRELRQSKVLAWVHRAFGKDSVRQRALRLLEEAAEAYQAAGGDETMAIRLMSYVFGRPVGDLPQEIGGVGVTLLALAATAEISADDEEQRELTRVLSKPVEHFAARNAAKNAAGFKAADTE